MKKVIPFIVVAVVLWFVLKPKKSVAADGTQQKSASLFGISGVVPGLFNPTSDSSVSSSTDSTTVTSTTDSTDRRTTGTTDSTTTTVTSTSDGPTLAVPTFAFVTKTKSPFKWKTDSQK